MLQAMQRTSWRVKKTGTLVLIPTFCSLAFPSHNRCLDMKEGHGKKKVNICQLFRAFLPKGPNKRLPEEPMEPFPASSI